MNNRYIDTKGDVAYLLRIMRMELEMPSIVVSAKFGIPIRDLIEYESGEQIPSISCVIKLLDYYTYHILYKKRRNL